MPLRGVLALLARQAGPTAIAALICVGLAGLYGRFHPAPQRSLNPDRLIVEEQLARAGTLPSCDVLILGDSAALMGVDALELGDALGRRVESLSTLGYVGPRGFAQILQEYAGRAKPGVLLLMLSHATLKVGSAEYEGNGMERLVLEGERPRPWPRGLLADGRDALFGNLVVPLADPPLPGSYGRVYGWPDALAREMAVHHGSLLDPNPGPPPHGRPVRIELSDAFLERLPALRAALDSVRPGSVKLLIAPIPATRAGASSTAERDAALEAVAHSLGLGEEATVRSPVTLPASMFATHTHLNAEGRREFTRIVAEHL